MKQCEETLQMIKYEESHQEYIMMNLLTAIALKQEQEYLIVYMRYRNNEVIGIYSAMLYLRQQDSMRMNTELSHIWLILGRHK